MTEKKADLRKMLMCMDGSRLIDIILSLSEKFGEAEVLRIVNAKVESGVDMDPENVMGLVENAIYMDDEEFYRHADDDGYGGSIDPGENASQIMADGMSDMFRDDVELLIESGRTDDAETYIRTIIKCLRDVSSTSILVEYSPDFLNDYADNMEECLKKGRPLDAFDYW